jgi:hypothetical protein
MDMLFSRGRRKPSSEPLEEELIANVAARTRGFSGREISKLFIALEYAALLVSGSLDSRLLEEVLASRLREHTDIAGLGSSRIEEDSDVDSVSADAAIGGSVSQTRARRSRAQNTRSRQIAE